MRTTSYTLPTPTRKQKDEKMKTGVVVVVAFELSR